MALAQSLPIEKGSGAVPLAEHVTYLPYVCYRNRSILFQETAPDPVFPPYNYLAPPDRKKTPGIFSTCRGGRVQREVTGLYHKVTETRRTACRTRTAAGRPLKDVARGARREAFDSAHGLFEPEPQSRWPEPVVGLLGRTILPARTMHGHGREQDSAFVAEAASAKWACPRHKRLRRNAPAFRGHTRRRLRLAESS